LREDYEIKQISEVMSRKDYSSDFFPKTARKDYTSTGFEDVYLSTPQTSQFTRTRIEAKHFQTDSQNPTIGSSTHNNHNLGHPESTLPRSRTVMR
jgi:hypothetical protein